MDSSLFPILYRGSVKDVLGPVAVPSLAPGERAVFFAYTDAFSVFDWGKMPDLLPRKGERLRKAVVRRRAAQQRQAHKDGHVTQILEVGLDGPTQAANARENAQIKKGVQFHEQGEAILADD